jgi:hypothetical protein
VSKTSRYKTIKCPFFRDLPEGAIKCEGVGDAESVQLNYGCRKDKRTQLEVFCERKWENCEIARLILATKYDDD